MAPTPPPAAPVNVTVQIDTAPTDDFGSEPPAFGDSQASTDAPLRRRKK